MAKTTHLVGLWIAIVVMVAGCTAVNLERNKQTSGQDVKTVADDTGMKQARVLFLYDSKKGLHVYDFTRKQFTFLGELRPDNPQQHVRALNFAVRDTDKTIYVADGQAHGYPLYILDLAEKRLTEVGRNRNYLYGSISFNPQNGLLYGVLWTNPHSDFLAIIDPKSGGFHKIAPIVTGANIAFAPNGDLYAVISGGYLASGIENGQLYQIDVRTGEHKLIGKAELDYTSTHFTISKDGVGYLLEHTGKLRTISLETGRSRLVGDSPCTSAFGMFEYEVPESLLRPMKASD